ncbi:MAG: Rpn family recombination-promoting nuclease/putative transposase [Candidatus Obscuribacterales bacterium]
MDNSLYLDPRNDLAFKKLFGDKEHKHITIEFLNAVFRLKGKDKIVDLTFLSPRQPAKVAARKESHVDVLVRDEKGFRYIIEMQSSKVPGFEKRAQYYAAKTYCSHFKQGDKYKELKKVIFLAIANYVVFPNKKGYKSDHITVDKETHENDLKDFSFTFVELPKFTKKLNELKTIEEKWYYFLKHGESGKMITSLAKEPILKEAYDVLDRHNWTEEELEEYERLVMSAADAEGVLEAAKEEGHQKGLQEGHQKGLQEGVQEGEKAKALEVARGLLRLGMKQADICKVTGLSSKELLALRGSRGTRK